MKRPKQLEARPACAMCHKPVESFTEEEGNGGLTGFLIFTARCHGQVERQKLHARDVRRGTLNFGMAFAAPRALPAAG